MQGLKKSVRQVHARNIDDYILETSTEIFQASKRKILLPLPNQFRTATMIMNDQLNEQKTEKTPSGISSDLVTNFDGFTLSLLDIVHSPAGPEFRNQNDADGLVNWGKSVPAMSYVL